MISKIITILAAIAEALSRFLRAQEQKQHEEQQQAIKKDPAGWFDDHFNGDANRVQADKHLPDDAAGADKAKPTKPNKDG